MDTTEEITNSEDDMKKDGDNYTEEEEDNKGEDDDSDYIESRHKNQILKTSVKTGLKRDKLKNNVNMAEKSNEEVDLAEKLN